MEFCTNLRLNFGLSLCSILLTAFPLLVLATENSSDCNRDLVLSNIKEFIESDQVQEAITEYNFKWINPLMIWEYVHTIDNICNSEEANFVRLCCANPDQFKSASYDDQFKYISRWVSFSTELRYCHRFPPLPMPLVKVSLIDLDEINSALKGAMEGLFLYLRVTLQRGYSEVPALNLGPKVQLKLQKEQNDLFITCVLIVLLVIIVLIIKMRLIMKERDRESAQRVSGYQNQVPELQDILDKWENSGKIWRPSGHQFCRERDQTFEAF